MLSADPEEDRRRRRLFCPWQLSRRLFDWYLSPTLLLLWVSSLEEFEEALDEALSREDNDSDPELEGDSEGYLGPFEHPTFPRAVPR